MKIKITADSTCDLPGYMLDEYDIGITPLSIVKDGVPYKDGIEITPQEIFDHVESNAGVCYTTAVNTQEYYDKFSKILKNYDAIVHINIGGKFSACNQNANIAASELDNVYVVDSESLSIGMGYQVLEAAKLARDGAEPDEIISRLDLIKEKTEMSFVINTVKYLYKGGRCSALAALGANILGLKPCIEVIDGLMDVGKKYRGSSVRIAEKYVTDRLSGRSDIDYKGIFVVHSGVEPEVLNTIHKTVERYGDFGEKYEGIAGCTISNHCGPNTFGIMFFRN